MKKLIIRPKTNNISKGMVYSNSKNFQCSLGWAGINRIKKEGDGKTPAGNFSLKQIYYREDRIPKPLSKIPTKSIEKDYGWCDQPSDPAYNQLVRLPYRGRAECLWRKDEIYDLIVVINHNTNPVIARAGSAIFIHIETLNFKHTNGCIGMKLKDLIYLLKRCNPSTKIDIKIK